MLERNREIWEALPFFFLTLGCAIGSGPLEVLDNCKCKLNSCFNQEHFSIA